MDNSKSNLIELAEKARIAGEIARNKPLHVRRMEEAARARDRRAYFEEVVQGEIDARDMYFYERFKG